MLLRHYDEGSSMKLSDKTREFVYRGKSLPWAERQGAHTRPFAKPTHAVFGRLLHVLDNVTSNQLRRFWEDCWLYLTLSGRIIISRNRLASRWQSRLATFFMSPYEGATVINLVS